MSGTVKWRPIEDAGRVVPFNADARALKMFQRAFDNYDGFVFYLDRSDLQILRGIEATDVEAEAIRMIINAIEDNESIVVEWIY